MAGTNPKEKVVEAYLRTMVEERGGKCLKLDPANLVGFPDRLVIMPQAIFIVEVKRPRGGRLSEHQKHWRKRIREMGHAHVLIWCNADVEEFMDLYDKEFGDYVASR